MELPDRAHVPSGPHARKGVKGGDVDVGENAMRRLGNHALRTAQGIWQVGRCALQLGKMFSIINEP